MFFYTTNSQLNVRKTHRHPLRTTCEGCLRRIDDVCRNGNPTKHAIVYCCELFPWDDGTETYSWITLTVTLGRTDAINALLRRKEIVDELLYSVVRIDETMNMVKYVGTNVSAYTPETLNIFISFPELREYIPNLLSSMKMNTQTLDMKKNGNTDSKHWETILGLDDEEQLNILSL